MRLTLCLHAGADQGQRVAGKLTAGAGDGSAGQQNQDTRVGAVGAVLLQVAVLQRLKRDAKKREKVNRSLTFKVLQLFCFGNQCYTTFCIYFSNP